ncbi:MAG: urease accessory protein UreE [Rhodomicrobiaceae bacterium]
MLRATTVILPPDSRLADPADRITLAREDRHRRRVAMTTDSGKPFLLDLPEAAYLANGCGLLLEDGGVVLVRAAEEPLLRIGAPEPATLARIAWHIGNRHTPAEITAEAIFIQPDHVLAEMVRGLGGAVESVMRPFEPEGGAYGGHAARGHGDHHHRHDHHHHEHDH